MSEIEIGKPGRTALLCFVLATAYAVVRYHVFGGVPWSRLPLYTLNKAVAFSAAALFAAACFSRGWDAGRIAVWLATLHVLMSLALLGPSCYPKLYLDGGLNFTGDLALLGGCLAFALCLIPAATVARYAVLAVAAAHVCAIGFTGWLTPRAWPGYMPPITLLSCLILAAPLAAKLVPKHE